ncbi:uncharacterized protein BYT42DRAFT_571012 [Radiomyces spectabilis]|uniref:uncharacterized protein n=1 Tax=Radiomyces spectabilis TaxID=64574 RepID=UPI00221F3084|nr:uncharacterized protein BYT42DRAFT_571012 [Radiomyces spectabilis]KAI8377630.1 hypothetical protein BYT42DRAFT_571012 [Radiomyces spectabilis]
MLNVYYCYSCQHRTIATMTPDLTCDYCHSPFLEETSDYREDLDFEPMLSDDHHHTVHSDLSTDSIPRFDEYAEESDMERHDYLHRLLSPPWVSDNEGSSTPDFYCSPLQRSESWRHSYDAGDSTADDDAFIVMDHAFMPFESHNFYPENEMDSPFLDFRPSFSDHETIYSSPPSEIFHDQWFEPEEDETVQEQERDQLLHDRFVRGGLMEDMMEDLADGEVDEAIVTYRALMQRMAGDEYSIVEDLIRGETAREPNDDPENSAGFFRLPFSRIERLFDVIYHGSPESDSENEDDHAYQRSFLDNWIDILTNRSARLANCDGVPQKQSLIPQCPIISTTRQPSEPNLRYLHVYKRRLRPTDKDVATECSICQERFGTELDIIRLSCRHEYHDECIHQWLRLKPTCPICRRSVTSDPVEQPDEARPSTGIHPASRRRSDLTNRASSRYADGSDGEDSETSWSLHPSDSLRMAWVDHHL